MTADQTPSNSDAKAAQTPNTSPAWWLEKFAAPLVVAIISVALSYWLFQRVQADLAEAQRTLTQIQTDIERDRQSFARMSLRSQAIKDLVEVVGKLRPHLKVEFDKSSSVPGHTIAFTLTLKNEGAHPLRVSPPALLVTAKADTPSGIRGVKTSLVRELHDPGFFASGAGGPYKFEFSLVDAEALDRITVDIEFANETDKRLREALSTVVEGHPIAKHLDAFSRDKSMIGIDYCRTAEKRWATC